MQTCNWIVIDCNNKKADLCAKIRVDFKHDIESKVLAIAKVVNFDYKEIKTAWLLLPNNYKTIHNSNNKGVS